MSESTRQKERYRDYAKYMQAQDTHTIHYLAHLLVPEDCPDDETSLKQNEIIEKLTQSTKNGELKAFIGKDNILRAKTPDIQEWARKFNDNKPAFLLPEFNESPALEEGYDYLINGEMPIELRAANEAYKHFYINKQIRQNQGHKPQIEKWLQEKYGKALSVAAKERISTVINPNKNGGAPPSS